MTSGERMTDVDVLVVGAGGAGLVAAIAAHEAGATVAVVERRRLVQGNTALSSGSIPGAGTRFQRACGVEDDPARFAADLRRVGGLHEADHLVDRLALVSAELIEWLVDVAGVELTLVETYRHVGHSVNRLHAPPSRRGVDLLRDLERAIGARGVTIALGNRCEGLVVEPDGRVAGAHIASGDSIAETVRAGAVILATNGFGADRELLRTHIPEAAGLAYAGAPGSLGDAVRWGRKLGARLANMNAYQGHAAVADPHGSLVTWTVIEKGGGVVGTDGRRFADETMGYSAFAAEEAVRGGRFFAIYDTRIRDATAAGQGEFAELVRMGGCITAGTPEELGRRIDIHGETLARTVEAMAAAATDGASDEFGRTGWGLGPLRAPYVATAIGPALFHTQGGLLVDDSARVTREQGGVVPGLWAAGGAAAGISGSNGSKGYVSGNGLLSALGLGLIAGRSAATAAGSSAPLLERSA
jgi:fumarate reductase flavoprotein subunit